MALIRVTDLMNRLDDWQDYEPAKVFCPEMLKDITEAAAEIERLEAALKPFADAIYNDNGDMTISPVGMDPYVNAYFTMRGRPSRTAGK